MKMINLLIFGIVMIYLVLIVDGVVYDDFESNTINASNWSTSGTTATNGAIVYQGSYSAKLGTTGALKSLMLDDVMLKTTGQYIVEIYVYCVPVGVDACQVDLMDGGGTTDFGFSLNYPTYLQYGYWIGAAWTTTGVSSNSGYTDSNNNWVRIRYLINNDDQNVSIKVNETLVVDSLVPIGSDDIENINPSSTNNDIMYIDKVSVWDYEVYGWSGTIPPIPNPANYNMTSDGGNTSWDIDPTSPISTTDGTPQVTFTTPATANCSMRTTNHTYDINYVCSTTEGNAHICNLYDADKLVFGNSNIFIGCVDTIAQNAYSPALAINMTAGGGGESLINCVSIVGTGCGWTTNADNCLVIEK